MKTIPFNIKNFRSAYEKWVKESLADYEAGNMTEIVKKYPLIKSTDIPWTPYTGNPSEQTFALITSGGIYLKDQQPAFDTHSIHGDTSFREIPRTAGQADLDISHPHYDHSLAKQDFNTIFPLERFLELEVEGIVGKVAHTHYSFSYVNDAATLAAKTIPELLDRIKAQGVDVLFFVPV